ncbi:DUF4383 domain-containing protein [Spirilliplanes yamanashiensis]|uniref:DUF4383 domain-containing protein n=1 Tax=Spirilliplanes yamanashiensis TaxID=42233 RepID=A0A8J3Y352_9ACTN|nr:DUF4383 domain-containing protein [Spirilliplanes yamanashiensis]MDP9814220.1 hypothetical protein [Spirilliplanes yamanashiensis]GIJ00798.1 hypothetical protein Sya03_01500 [Spirilliplanes yamanashiensis]
MAHTPVNHPLRPVYRALGGLAGLYLVLFGILGLIQTAGDGLFALGIDHVLGQGTNLAWSIVSLVVGALVLLATAVGRNLDVAADLYLGWALLGVGSAMLALIRTDANIFNFSLTTVIVTYVVGLVLVMAGLYSKVVAPERAGAPRQVLQEQANA